MNRPVNTRTAIHVACPCSKCVGGVLVAYNDRGEAISSNELDRNGAHRWTCNGSCGYAVDQHDAAGSHLCCPNDGGPLRFDLSIVGETAGGLQLRGWNVCDHCGSIWLTRQGRPDAGGRADGRWRLAGGGRSLDAGGIRLRADGKGESGTSVVTLMARLSRMPAFEAALERIARGDMDADQMKRLAGEALAIADGVDELDA